MSSSLESSIGFLPSFDDTFSAPNTQIERFQPGMVYQRRPPMLPPSVPVLPSNPLRRSSRVSGPPDRYGFPSLMAAIRGKFPPEDYSHRGKIPIRINTRNSGDGHHPIPMRRGWGFPNILVPGMDEPLRSRVENHGIDKKLMEKVKQLVNSHYEDNSKESFYESEMAKRLNNKDDLKDTDWESSFFIWHHPKSNINEITNLSKDLRSLYLICYFNFFYEASLVNYSDGNVPLWDAMLGGHEHVIKLLMDNGANLNSGDMDHLLEEIVRHGGVVTEPRKNGSTALHVGVCEDNNEIVRFLLDLAICLLMVQKL
ncbi:hypothetical protein Pint_05360 [Pistacia integerrima]|uniref:Uncharacterized protein n=1 Tax=Pistacia integerrima TaxID=434235 RepID=A0ACC0Z7S8_9ROSI|nr:hypothetical protein Pint_05360 [Pistacia integerrima]